MHDALELATRRRVYEIISTHAGIHVREIERRSNMSTGMVQHHLSFLRRHGLLVDEKQGNKVRYFPSTFSPNRQLLSFLREESMRKMLLLLLEHDCNHQQLVGWTELSPSTVTWHLKKLEQQQIISVRQKGRKKYYHLDPSDEVIKLLVTYQQSFLDTLVDRIIKMWEL